MKKTTLQRAKSKPSASKSKASEPATGAMYRRLSAAVSEMGAIRSGKATATRTWEVVPDGNGGFKRRQISGVPALAVEAGNVANEAVRARQRLGLSQDTFAALIGVSSGTLRGWEQGRRQPTRAARVLLRVATKYPEAVLEAAKSAA